MPLPPSDDVHDRERVVVRPSIDRLATLIANLTASLDARTAELGEAEARIVGENDLRKLGAEFELRC